MTGREERRGLGAFRPGDRPATPGTASLRRALESLAAPVQVVEVEGQLGAGEGTPRLGDRPGPGELPLLGFVPALLPEQLGDPAFRTTHGVRFAYVAGEMANGIASEELVEAVARGGGLAFFGAAGLSPARVEVAIDRLQRSLPDLPYGFNLIHSPGEPLLEAAVVDLYLRRGVHLASASAFLDLTLPVVRFRVHGIRRGPDGEPVTPNRLVAKVSRPEVARRFLAPPPERLLAMLVELGELTREQAELAAHIPMAEDLTAEADSGGHTDNRPMLVLLPELCAVRDELQEKHRYAVRPRVGAAGGIATPAAAAAAFSLGAAYVMTGSVNQACREAGTSDLVRQMLAAAGPSDVAMAPAADMFEMGVQLQVLSRGTMFAVRAARLYELYRAHESLDDLPAVARLEVESKLLRSTIEEAWEGCRAFFAERDPSQIERAEREPRHKMALVFRSYLGRSSSWANEGVADRRLDFQIWCGPAMGAFNDWVRGSPLEAWDARRAVPVMKNLVWGAAYGARIAALRSQGVALPGELRVFAARSEAELDAMVAPVAAVRRSATAAAAVPVAAAPAAAFDPIAIVGMGCLFPGAPDLRAYWRLLRTGTDAVREIPASQFDLADYHDPDPAAPDHTYARRGAFLDPVAFDPTEFGIPPSTLEATDTSQLLALVAARMALEDAGLWGNPRWDRNRTAVVLGVTGAQELVIPLAARLGHPQWRRALRDAGVADDQADDVVDRIAASWVGWQEGSFPGLLGNVVAGRIANRFDLGGTNCVVDAACASSLGAVHLACLELSAGKADVVLTGGADTFSDVFMHMCFSKTPALSPTGDARPFSEGADGTVLGEGLGILVLRRLSDARRDGDRIHAVIRGLGSSSDGRARSIYAPRAEGQVRALHQAYEQAGFGPATVGLVEAHGTGTKAGDAAELSALGTVFAGDGATPGATALGSVKSQIGHAKAAAGAASLIKVALALRYKVLPPTIKAERPAATLGGSPFHLATAPRPWMSGGAARRAGVSAFGFGGSNFHVVLEEASPIPEAPAWDGAVEIVALSAADPAALAARLAALGDEPGARTRARFRSSDPHRLILLIPAGEERAAIVARAAERLSRPVAAGNDGRVFHGTGSAPGSLAFLFPGQGSQQVGMLAELTFAFPELLAALEAAPDVAALVHPAPTVDPAARKEAEERLTRTESAQPALAAVERGLVSLLSRFGVRPALAAGHSFGELSALHAAGRLDGAELQELAALRGRLMAGAEPGGMLAVMAPAAAVVALELAGVTVANLNAPTQVVLSGSHAAIAAAEIACTAAGLRSRRLPVGAAFHSPLVAGAAGELGKELPRFPLPPGSVPVISGATAAPYPEDPEGTRELLATQLALPVRFQEVVEHLHAQGARTFLEVGPRGVLTSLVGAILEDRPHLAIALDATPGGMLGLATALARLAAAGHGVDLSAWDPGNDRTVPKPRMNVPLTGANVRPAAASPRPPVAWAAPMESPMKNGNPPPNLDPIVEALHQSQESLRALQSLQEQTAQAHQSFLDGQRAAQETFGQLLAGQQRIVEVALGLPASELPVYVAPAYVAPAAPAPRSAPPARVAPPPPAPTRVSPPPPAPARAAPAPARAKRAEPPPPDVTATLLAVVSEATGYPAEMLDLDMDLEADLGIDSIKRVEILSLLSQRIDGAPAVDPERLGTLRTLRQVAEFAGGTVAAAPAPAANGKTGAEHHNGQDHNGQDPEGVLLGVVSELTGYPREMLGLDMELEAELGIDSIKRVEILSVLSRRLPGAPQVDPERLGGLRTLRHVLELTSPGRTPRAPAPVVEEAQARRQEVVAVRLPAAAPAPLPRSAAVVGGDPVLGRALAAALARRGVPAADDPDLLVVLAGDDPLLGALAQVRDRGAALRARRGTLVLVWRGDGAFGFATGAGGEAAGVGGLARTAAAEWPELSVRSIDLSAQLGTEAAAERFAAELAGTGPAEVGLGPAGRVGIALREAPFAGGASTLKAGDLVVITGGARGVTATCAVALAGSAPLRLLLLGRSPLPATEPTWLAAASDAASIQAALLAHGFPGGRPTPRELAAAAARVTAGREIRATLAAIESAGSTARYAEVDARDPAAVARALEEARAWAGPVRAIVHGAGVVRDRRLEDKGEDEAREVIDTKLAGLRSLLTATASDPLRVVALFASVSGRFGRRGQADYAMANAALAAIARGESRRRPGCRVVAIDWGAWDGGMVHGEVRRAFEREGIGLLAPKAGAAALVAELSASGAGEVVIAAGSPSAADPGFGLAALHALDPGAPLLADHVLDGKPVLPVALIASFFDDAARAALGNAAELADFRLLKGLVIDGPTHVAVWARPAGDALELELRGEDDRVHARARARRPLTSPAAAPDPGSLAPYPGTPYPDALFHGAAWQVIEEIAGVGEHGVEVVLRTSGAAFDALALDGIFQALVLWSRTRLQAPSLPAAFERFHQLGPLPARVRAAVRVREVLGAVVVSDAALLDGEGRIVARLDGYACTASTSLERAWRRREASAA